MSLTRAAFGARGRIFGSVPDEDLPVLREGMRLIWRAVESTDEETKLRAWALLNMVNSEIARRTAEAEEEAKKR